MKFQLFFCSLQANTKKTLDEQQNYLKNYYQNQLEEVVRKKMEDYQQQLDTIETQVRRETKKTEKLIAERAIKQIELMNLK